MHQSDMKSQPTKLSAFADISTATLSVKTDNFVGCDFMSLLKLELPTL